MMTLSNAPYMRSDQQQKCDVRIIAPYPITHRFKAKDEFEGRTLLDLMSTRFPFRESDKWQERISSGHIGVNGKEVKPNALLKSNDVIFHHNPRVIEPSVPDEVRVLDVQDEYVFVFKPSPMPMHPGGRYFKNTLTAILEEKGFTGLKVVHRLDAVTSGIVLFAKTKSFAKKAMTYFTNGMVEKTYYALVSGIPKEKEIEIDFPIRRKTGFVFESASGLDKAKHAVTRFEVVSEFEQSALIRCNPVTGRTHQIRLHLEKWGHPIIDDPIYGIYGDKSSRKAQNRGISLINAGMKIEELEIEHRLEVPDAWIGI